jgi:hypothetical protein
MRLQKTATIAVGVLVLMAAQGTSQEMPKPAPEMAKIDFFEGNWTCNGKMNASPMGPAGTMTSTADIRKDLGGFWQSGSIKGTMQNMPPFEGMFHTTYDPAAKQYLMFWVDNMGGWARSTSPGWQGDKMVYNGDSHMPGQKPMKGRDTFTRSGTSMKHVWELQMDGKWMTLGEETCTKK